MPKAKMVMKQCPKCEQQVPVACKACPCGHIYFQTRKPVSAPRASGRCSSGIVSAVKRRRTERIRQVRVNRESLRSFTKTVSRPARLPRTSTSTSVESESTVETTLYDDFPKKRRGRQKRNSSGEREAEADCEDSALANVSPEKALRYSIILAEINRKLGCNLIQL